jgi:Pyridoxamine 5'-phosphate oxidase
VNYRLIDGAIVFWTSPGSKMAAAAEGAVVAFEVDDYQLADRTGWSVLAVGRADVVTDPDMAETVKATCLQPFVDGRRDTLVRIEPTFLPVDAWSTETCPAEASDGHPQWPRGFRHRAAIAPPRRDQTCAAAGPSEAQLARARQRGDDLLRSVGRVWTTRTSAMTRRSR